MPDLTSRVRHVAITLDLENAPDVAWPWEADAGQLMPSEILLGYTRWPRGGKITVMARVTGYLRGSDRTRLTDRLDIDLDRLPDGLAEWVQELADQNMPDAFRPEQSAQRRDDFADGGVNDIRELYRLHADLGAPLGQDVSDGGPDA